MNGNEVREHGELPVGLMVDGVLHTKYVLRPSTINDLLEVEASPIAKKGDWHRNVSILAKQTESLGTLASTQISFSTFKRLTTVDLFELMAADKRLEQKLITFRKGPQRQDHAQDGAGPGEQDGLE